MMDDREAYEYYADPEHRKPTGPPRKRQGQRLTSMSSVRFAPEVIEAVKAIAFGEGITVGSWIRRLVDREISAPETTEIVVEGLAEPLRVPSDAMERVIAALMPALIRHGSLNLHIGTARRPAGLIPGSGRRGEPKALGSSLALKSRTFACEHMSIGGVQDAACGVCGPLQLAG
jgi:hypothetical protein